MQLQGSCSAVAFRYLDLGSFVSFQLCFRTPEELTELNSSRITLQLADRDAPRWSVRKRADLSRCRCLCRRQLLPMLLPVSFLFSLGLSVVRLLD